MRQAQPNLFGGQLDTLDRARRKKMQHEAETFERLAKRAGLDPETAAILAMGLKPQQRTDWIFVMISPQQNAAVIEWLMTNSQRPKTAALLWANMLAAMRYDTGEILMTREQMAERVGCKANNISAVMKDFMTINAVRKSKDGRKVKYHMNPNIATHQPDPEARKEARDNAGPLLTLMTGGKD